MIEKLPVTKPGEWEYLPTHDIGLKINEIIDLITSRATPWISSLNCEIKSIQKEFKEAKDRPLLKAGDRITIEGDPNGEGTVRVIGYPTTVENTNPITGADTVEESLDKKDQVTITFVREDITTIAAAIQSCGYPLVQKIWNDTVYKNSNKPGCDHCGPEDKLEKRRLYRVNGHSFCPHCGREL